jgi:hypothetical protein
MLQVCKVAQAVIQGCRGVGPIQALPRWDRVEVGALLAVSGLSDRFFLTDVEDVKQDLFLASRIH